MCDGTIQRHKFVFFPTGRIIANRGSCFQIGYSRKMTECIRKSYRMFTTLYKAMLKDLRCDWVRIRIATSDLRCPVSSVFDLAPVFFIWCSSASRHRPSLRHDEIRSFMAAIASGSFSLRPSRLAFTTVPSISEVIDSRDL
jgi:hypothetical protein